METNQVKRPALPLLALLALASALGVAVAVTLAGVAMLLAAPAYAEEGNLFLKRRSAMAEATRVSAEIESQKEGEAVLTRVLEVYHNPYDEPLGGVYVYRLPAHAQIERLSFAPGEAQPRLAVLSRREAAGLIEPIETLGPGETLIVELDYRVRSTRRMLALGDAGF